MRATPPPSAAGLHGRTLNVVGSGMAIMSDSSIALKPVIDEPSKPMPPSKASSSSEALIENDFNCPRMSVNQRRMKRMLRSSTSALTSSAFCGRSLTGGRLTHARWTGGPDRLQPAVRPGLQLFEGRGQLAPAGGGLVLDRRGRGLRHAAPDDPVGLELLHALGEQAVRQIGHGVGDLAEAHAAALQEDVEDRPRPALADELDGLVEVGTAGALRLR